MKIIKDKIEQISDVSLILGFFDGIHAGHRNVIKTATEYAQNNKTKSLLLTFKNSPADFFTHKTDYIFNREHSYKIIESLGVDYLIELDFSTLVNYSAKDYLENFLIKNFSPISISTGSNHTFGKNKEGNPKLLKQNETLYNYKYFCVDTVKFNHNIISSTYIKKLLSIGEIEKANKILMSNFSLEGKIIHGEGLAKNLGFPTANMKYPEKITKIPYGVYKILVNNTPAILNWGIKPTFRNKEETLEIHIPNYNKNLYSKNLKFEIIKKIRDEQKFKDIESLQAQIKKDIEECLK